MIPVRMCEQPALQVRVKLNFITRFCFLMKILIGWDVLLPITNRILKFSLQELFKAPKFDF